MRLPTQQQRLGIRLLTEQLSSYGLANLATAERDAVEYLRELAEAAEPEELPTTRAQLQLAVDRMAAFCDAVAPASAITEAMRNTGLGAVWDGLMDAVKRLPSVGVHVWEVQNLTDCCGGCPAGGYEECLVSPLDARVKAVNIGGPAPDGCPLRNGGSVLLVGESGA